MKYKREKYKICQYTVKYRQGEMHPTESMNDKPAPNIKLAITIKK
ncbi:MULTISPECIES: hypothetical protein [Chitinophagaceae]